MLLLQPASRNLRRLRRRDVILPVTSVRAANGLAEISKSAVNIAIIRVCDYVRDSVRVSVCLSVRTIKLKRLKLKSPNLAQG